MATPQSTGDRRIEFAVMVVVTAIWMALHLAYVGPPRWLGEAQLKYFGWHSWLLSFIALPLPIAFLLGRVANRYFRSAGSRVRLEVLGLFLVPALLIVGTTVIAGIGLRHWISPQLGSMNLDDALRVEDDSFYATIKARVAGNPIGISKKGSDYYYVPLGGERAAPVGLFAAGTKYDLASLRNSAIGEPVTVSGLVDNALSSVPSEKFDHELAFLARSTAARIDSALLVH